jgi:lambda family phage tail tape measure protein
MATIGSLSVKLGLVTVEWDQATNKAKKQAKDLQTAFNNLGKELNVVQRMFGSFAGSFNLTGIGIAALTQKAFALSREVQDMADAFGISIHKLLEYRAALEMSGVSAENTGKVMASVYSKIAEAQSGVGGSQSLVNHLAEMGISLKELVGLKPEDAFKRIAQGIATIDDQYKKSQFTQEFLGRGGKTFGAKQFLDSLGQVTDKYYEQEKAVARLAAIDDQLKTSMQNLTLAFGDLISKFTGNGNFIISVDTFKTALEAIGSYLVIKGILSTTAAIGELYYAIKKLEDFAITGLGVTPFLDKIIKFASNPYVIALITALYSKDLNKGEMGQLDLALAKGDVKVDDKGGLIDVKKAQADADKIENAKKLSELNNKLYGQLNAQIKLEAEKIEFEKQSTQIKLDAYNVDEYTTKNKEIQLKYEQQIAQLKSEQASASKGKEGHELELVNKLYETRRQLAQQTYVDEVALADKQKEIQTNFIEGWKNAYQQYVNESQKTGEQAAESFNNMAKSLEDTLTTFFETGKLNFRSFASSIIHEMARIQAQAAAKSIMGLFGGSGDFFSSLISGVFGGGGGALSTAGVNSSLGDLYIPSLLHSAGGNDINAGQPSMVGENGPEMFIPKQSGKIVSNTNTNQMMGQNQPQIVYNGPYIANMSAIDTQSGLQFLAKNKQGVWAANQSAQRGLPQSR